MDDNALPGQVLRLDADEAFCFACHADVPCFTECCRQLDLVLSPYDVLRLRKNLGLPSDRFLDLYAVVEMDEASSFPQVYLAMVDDGRASCPFVGPRGCAVYSDRPAACRLYPVGRGASRRVGGSIEEQFVLLREPHCQGFLQPVTRTLSSWYADQNLQLYIKYNDMLTGIVQHPQIRGGTVLSQKQLDTYLLALYNLDLFRQQTLAAEIQDIATEEGYSPEKLAESDECLLEFAMIWLRRGLFG
jgi:Fe-S-cluster containining protein